MICVLGHVDVTAQPEGDLRLHAGLQQGAHRDRGAVSAVADIHVAEQVAEVGLVDAELVLHRLGGGADLAADDGHASGQPLLDEPLLHGVRRRQVVGPDQIANRRARHSRLQRLRKPLGGRGDGGGISLDGGHIAILEPVTVLR